MSKLTITWNAEKWPPLFFTIWSGQTISWLGSAVAQFGLIWWITAKTGSATALAVATMISFLPNILLGPLAGALIDRWNRRLVMLVADGVIALASLWLAYLFWTDTLQLWQVYVVMLIRALGMVFHWPANQASISLMVPKEHLPRIAGANQTIGGAVNILSPPLGALFVQIMPFYWIMLIDVITALFSIAPLLVIIIPQQTSPPSQATLAANISAIWKDMLDGFRYIWNWPGLFWLLIIVMLLNFFVNPAMSLIPILVTRYFKGGAVELGWMNASWGAGLLIGGVILGIWGGFRKRVYTLLTGILGMGVGILLVGLAPANLAFIAIAGFFIASVMNAITNGSAFALLQTAVAPELQGRVFTVVGSLAGAMSPLSLAIGGPLADGLGVRTLYLIAGGAQIILALGGFMIPVILTLEQATPTQTVTPAVGES